MHTYKGGVGDWAAAGFVARHICSTTNTPLQPQCVGMALLEAPAELAAKLPRTCHPALAPHFTAMTEQQHMQLHASGVQLHRFDWSQLLARAQQLDTSSWCDIDSAQLSAQPSARAALAELVARAMRRCQPGGDFEASLAH